MKKLTPAYRQLYYSLRYKYKYFSRKHLLGEDGSFYYDDKRLAEEQGVDDKTIGRGVVFLNEQGYIKIQRGRHKGVATKYWLSSKPPKMSTFTDKSKPDNLSTKPDNLTPKAPQNVYPNKVIIKKITNCVNNQSDEELKQGLYGLIKLTDLEYAKAFYIGRGFNKDRINKLLESDSFVLDKALNSKDYAKARRI